MKNKLGSTLILLVITIAIASLLASSLLIVSLTNLKLKKDNTAIKQALYLSEAGLNMAYVRAYELVEYSIEDSMKKVESYLEMHDSSEEAEDLFHNTYKLNIIGNINNALENNTNPKVRILDPVELLFIDENLKFTLQSEYIDDGLAQITYVDMIIQVADYSDLLLDKVNIENLISLENWGFSGE